MDGRLILGVWGEVVRVSAAWADVTRYGLGVNPARPPGLWGAPIGRPVG